jgi:amidase
VNDLVKLTARQAVDLLKNKKVSPLELIDAALERIEETDGAINALPTICADRARHHARQIMDAPSDDSSPRGQLYGLPLAIKDLKDVAGVRSTKGSLIYADHVPETSDRLVTNIESRGGIVLAKSNTPEFGAGANTFNDVFVRDQPLPNRRLI